MYPCRVAILHRQVKRLATIAAERAAQADGYRGDDRFRLLNEAEAETIVGGDLLASLNDVTRS
jgi:hypothetical protein